MKTIRQTVTFRGATPHDVYEVILDPRKHSKLTRTRVKMSRRVGGKFTVGRDLAGKNLALVKDKKIVQAWRANNWATEHYSRATFAIARAKGGARLTFTQTGVPDGFRREISDGWKRYYWRPMRSLFKKS